MARRVGSTTALRSAVKSNEFLAASFIVSTATLTHHSWKRLQKGHKAEAAATLFLALLSGYASLTYLKKCEAYQRYRLWREVSKFDTGLSRAEFNTHYNASPR